MQQCGSLPTSNGTPPKSCRPVGNVRRSALGALVGPAAFAVVGHVVLETAIGQRVQVQRQEGHARGAACDGPRPARPTTPRPSIIAVTTRACWVASASLGASQRSWSMTSLPLPTGISSSAPG